MSQNVFPIQPWSSTRAPDPYGRTGRTPVSSKSRYVSLPREDPPRGRRWNDSGSWAEYIRMSKTKKDIKRRKENKERILMKPCKCSRYSPDQLIPTKLPRGFSWWCGVQFAYIIRVTKKERILESKQKKEEKTELYALFGWKTTVYVCCLT